MLTAVSEAQWIVGIQVAKFLVEVQKASSLFCLVQNGPGVTWVACIGLK